MKKLLKGGRVVDPANGIDGVRDVLIDGDRIARVGRDLPGRRRDGRRDSRRASSCVRAASTCTCTCASRARSTRKRWRRAPPSAVAGGFTAVACMPNTTPVNDNANVTALHSRRRRAEANLARVYPIGAVSQGSKGELLADIAELQQGRLRRHHRRRASGGDGAAAAARARVRRACSACR